MWRLLRTPALWAEAVRAAAASAPKRWWARFPYLPLPDREYVRWRVATAYGVAGSRPRGDDLVVYLAWRRRQRRLARASS